MAKCSECGNERSSGRTTAGGQEALPFRWTRTAEGDPLCPDCKPDVAVRNYVYECKPPTGESRRLIEEQMRLAHRYRNALVETERRRRTRVDSAVREVCPALAEVEAKIAAEEAALAAVREAIRAGNAAARKKQTGTAEQKAEVKAVTARLKPLWQRRKELRAETFAGDALRSILAEVEAWAKGENQRLYNEAFAALHWGSRVHVAASCRSLRSGAPPEFVRFRGDGHIAVQLQGGVPADEAVVALDRGASWDPPPKGQFFVRTVGDHPRKPHAHIGIRVGTVDGSTAPVWATLFCRLHRPFPPDSRLKMVHLTRRREGTRDLWHVVVSVENVPPVTDRAESGRVGVDVGWRKLPDGRLRVASWAGDDGRTGELTMSAEYVERCQRIPGLDSTRKKLFNVAHARLLEWVAANPLPAAWTEVTEAAPRPPAAHLSAWRSEARLRQLVEFWTANRLPGDEAVFGDPAALAAERERLLARHAPNRDAGNLAYHQVVKAAAGQGDLYAWRLQDIHLLEYRVGLQRRTRAHREERMRLLAVGLRRRYRTAAVEDINWREDVLEKPEAEHDDELAAVRAFHRMAAPGRLLQLLAEHTAETVRVAPDHTTTDCHACGRRCEFDAARVLVHTCEHCGATWDQDHNAAVNLLNAEPAAAEA